MKTFITKLTESVTIKLPKFGSLIMKTLFDNGKNTKNVYLLSSTPCKVEGIGDTQVKLVSDTNYLDTISLPAVNWVDNDDKIKKTKITVFNPNSNYGEFQITNFDGNLLLAGTDRWGYAANVMIDNPILLKRNNYAYSMDADIDLSFFKENSKIIYILCNNTRIHGDISSLANCTALGLLCLSNTNISGDIASLANCTALGLLCLSNTNISGDIASLANCTELKQLELISTQVSGDITNIVTNLTKLNALSIPSTVTITDAQKKTLTDRGCTVTIR